MRALDWLQEHGSHFGGDLVEGLCLSPSGITTVTSGKVSLHHCQLD